VAVAAQAARRDLIVDGDLEASSAGEPRNTEELLALLPLLLHPRAERLLEVGFGSGISLGMAARFPLERIDCAEIAASVLGAAGFFAPENGGIAAGSDPRVEIRHADGRIALQRRAATYDVVLANTVQPWSLGATGLYSQEYFERMARALREGGLAVQWLPVEQLGGRNLAAILRTFYAVFPDGGLWWGAGNVLAVGSLAPLAPLDPVAVAAGLARAGNLPERLLLRDAAELARRRLAGASAVREALGAGEMLRDDRPLLEARAARARVAGAGGGELAVLLRIAEAGARESAAAEPIHVWLEAQARRAAGAEAEADALEAAAAAAGLGLAQRERVLRTLARGSEALAAGQLGAAEAGFQAALETGVLATGARFGLALVAWERRQLEAAAAELEAVVTSEPDHAEAWNLLGAVRAARGDDAGAALALEHSVEAAPFYVEALANLGLVAAARGDAPTARRMLDRLRAATPAGSSPEIEALREALAGG
jgi:spermidine synthase